MNYIQQAYKGQRELWMFILTTFLVAGIFISNFVFYLVSDPSDLDAAMDAMKNWNLPANVILAINLLPFVFLLGLLFILVKFVHQRSLLSLTTTRLKVDYKRILFSFLMITIYTVVSFFIMYSMDSSEIEFQFNLCNRCNLCNRYNRCNRKPDLLHLFPSHNTPLFTKLFHCMLEF